LTSLGLYGTLGFVLVGCPVLGRAYLIPRWFAHVTAACERAGVAAEFVFVVDPVRSATTVDAICGSADGRPVHVVAVDDSAAPRGRDWHAAGRIERMVELRNLLLGAVRGFAPDLFLSCDSDILVHPEAVASMLDARRDLGFGAVGGKVFLSQRGRGSPSYATFNPTGAMRRPDTSAVVRADVLMACVLMSPDAYNVDYVHDHRGEDIGWSRNCTKAGVRLGFDGRVTSKHVWAPEMRDTVDARVGF
jgi:hypothetical protein